jgi:holo-ACP synthase/triphosphoribosyl-dephospho-CoA synthase
MEVLHKILEARERRFSLRNEMAKKGLASVSLNFNMAGFPKTNERIHKAFNMVLGDFKMHLLAHRVSIEAEELRQVQDEAGDFFIQAVNSHNHALKALKAILENFEETHSLGRLLDADLFSAEGVPVSSGKLKKCLLCDEAAKLCIKAQKHDIEQIRRVAIERIEAFLDSQLKKKLLKEIPALALRAILYEVSVKDKPGLVCPDSQGSHTDMDYLSFVNSSAALSTYFSNLTHFALESKEQNQEKVLIGLRKLGIQAEADMFAATQGVNTQKGIVFLLGLSIYAVTKVLYTAKQWNEEEVRLLVSGLSRGLVSSELEKQSQAKGSHGEKCYQKYGKEWAGGIRQEAEKGFPLVFEYALPFLRKQKAPLGQYVNNPSVNTILLNCLNLIVSKNKDTNILHRKGKEELLQLQELAGEAFHSNGNTNQKLLDFCHEKQISPGGSADLLALSLFFTFIENFELN